MTHAKTNGSHGAKAAHAIPAETASKAREQVGSVFEALTEGIAQQARENPYSMIAAALGAGYVLGGGLFTKTTMRVLGLGARAAMLPGVREPLLDLVEKAIDAALERTGSTLGSDDDQKSVS